LIFLAYNPKVSVIMPSDALASSVEQDLRRKVEELEQKLAESHQREVATREVLSVIGTSPNDVQPVFQAIAERARHLCKAEIGATSRLEGDVVHLAGVRGPSAEAEQAMRDFFPVELQHAPANIRHALAQRAPFQIADVRLEPAYPDAETAERMGVRSIVSVPLLHEGRAIGTIGVARGEPERFADETIALLQTFARQAVIAIENTRLFEAERARTREVEEALEIQTATAGILRVIASSPSDLAPVLSAVAESAARLCDASDALVLLRKGDELHALAHHGPIPAHAGGPIARDWVIGRAFVDRTPLQVADLAAAGADFPRGHAMAISDGFRTSLAVPLMRRQGEAVGVICIRRIEVRPFTEKQIALLQTFADQAVIAIENTRLFEEVRTRTKELTESLEQQTATSEVLSVISNSPTDVQPVLDAIVKTATTICASYDAVILLRDGEDLRIAAHYGPMALDFERVPIGRDWVAGSAVVDRVPVHVHDLAARGDDFPLGRQFARRLNQRTVLGLPLLREGQAIGCLFLRRAEVLPFTDKQIALLQTFADQAVIAIENTRLFEEVQARTRELTQSLEYQTATSEVLSVISRSPTDVQPVFDTIAKSALHLCSGTFSSVLRFDGRLIHFAAAHGMTPEGFEALRSTYPLPPGRAGATTRAIETAALAEIPDVDADPDFEHRHVAGAQNFKSLASVPMLKDGHPIGTITVGKTKTGRFPERQIALLRTFADQAVIAIENTRLFEEVQARTRELAKTVEDLEIASQHKSQFVANMSHELRTPLAAVLGYAELMQEGFYGALSEKSTDALTRIRSNGKHLLGLINTVLDIAKIESGQFSLNLSEYAIENVVETVRSATESLAETKKLALKTEVAKKLPIGLGDEQRLTQVLLNLVGNAIKFTDTGEVRITATAMNGHFTVAVTDTGPGIPQQELNRVFEQFHQIDNSNTKAKGGTGLGLAIAKQIVEMHGGRIWVESTLGEGATFQMELPIRAEGHKGAAQ